MKLYFVQLVNGPFYGMHEQAVIRAWDTEAAIELMLGTYPDKYEAKLKFTTTELVADGAVGVYFCKLDDNGELVIEEAV